MIFYELNRYFIQVLRHTLDVNFRQLSKLETTSQRKLIDFFFLSNLLVCLLAVILFFEKNSFERCPSNKDFGSFSYIRVVTILDVRVDLWGVIWLIFYEW